MKQVSTGYKNQIKEMGREIDSIITYYNHYQVITENNKYILTEDGQKILTEQIKEGSHIDITAEDIYSVKIITHGDLLKTMMKELDFEVRQDMKIGSLVSYKFGLKVNGEYEYVDYGTFIVNEKEYNEDTQTYSYKAYDMMLKSMIPYKDTNDYPTTLYDVLNNVLEYCGLGIGVSEFPNSERDIYDDPFSGLDITCRDVLDFITEVTGCSSYMDGNDFIIMWPNDTDLTLDENSFKDSNVKFNEVYGPINSILFSRSEDTDVVEIKDETSIEQNGVTQIKIKDNPLLEDNDRDEYFQEMFDVLNGMTYTLNEYSSTGITYLDYYDKYKVMIGDNEYDCIMINDEINIEQGLTENVFTEKPEENQDKYVTSRLSDKDEKWANIQVKKDLGQISLEVGQKVDSNEVISAINLSPEQIAINSNKVSLNGKTIALTSDNINISSNNFSVDTAGNMTCNGANMNNANVDGGSITLKTSGSTAKFIVQDSQTSTCQWSQSARRILWKGLNNGTIEIWNSMASPTMGMVDGSDSSKTVQISPYGVSFDQGSRRAVETTASYGNTSPITIMKFVYQTNPYVEITTDYGVYGINAWASDKRLKEDIKDSDYKALEVVNKIKHRDFIYKHNKGHIPIGYIADELKEIDENLIIEVGEDKLKQPNETYLIPILSKAIQEQQEQINELKKEIEELKKVIK